MIGNIVRHYQIVESLGAGGMGVVFKARDQRLGRFVAIKFLPERFHNDRETLDRFLREAQTASSLNHPGICTVYDFDEYEGRPFIVMELLEGMTLRQRLTQGPMRPTEVLPWMTQVLEALGAAHSQGIVHRDIKPENIFLTRDNRVKLLDFGLAKPFLAEAAGSERTTLTEPGILMGTIPYMAPEQVRGETLDLRADLYSVGLVFYEAVTGRLPTRCATVALSLVAILQETPSAMSRVVPEIGDQWDWFASRALAKEPGLRFQSAAEMLNELCRLGGVLSPFSSILSCGHSGVVWASFSQPGSGVAPPGQVAETLSGRAEECRQIVRLFGQAAAGRGCVVLLEGEAGIGKTRLLEFALAQARQSGWAVQVGRCSELEGTFPFYPFVEMLEETAQVHPPEVLRTLLGDAAPELAKLAPRLRRILPGGAEPIELPPEQERFLLFNSLLDFFRRYAGNRPLLLALEDLHWADEPTTTFLQYLAKHLQGRPILIFATIREGGFDSEGPLAMAYRELLRGRLVSRMRLKRLDAAGISSMLEALANSPPPELIVREIQEVTDGNPFFIEELFYDLSEDGLVDPQGNWQPSLDLKDLRVPEGIRILLNRRLFRLQEDTMKALQMGALIGRSFSLALLASSMVTKEAQLIDTIEEAERQQQITTSVVDGEVVCTFAHALLRHTLLDSISPARRQFQHVRIADAIARLAESRGESRAAELARHLLEAGSAVPPERLRPALMRAAAEALEKTAFEDAVRYCSAFLETGRVEPGERAEVLFMKGLAHTGLIDWKAAQGVWLEALDLLEQAGDAVLSGKICSILAGQFIWSGKLENCVTIARRGLRMVGESPSPGRCRLLAWAGHGLNQAGRLEEGRKLTAQALQAAEALGDSRLVGHILTHRACEEFYSMHFGATVEMADQAVERISTGSLWDRVEAQAVAQCALFGAGRFDEVEKRWPSLAEVASRIGHLGCLWMGQRIRGLCSVVRSGNIAQLKELGHQDRMTCEQGNVRWISESHGWLGFAELLAGNWEQAEEHFRTSAELEPRDFTQGLDSSSRLLWKAYAGNREEARQESRIVRSRLAAEPPNSVGSWSALLNLVEVFALLGEHEAAGSLLPHVRHQLEIGNVVRFNGIGLMSTTAAIAAACAGDIEAAEQYFRRSLDSADELPHRLDQVEARRWYWWCLRTFGGAGSSRKAENLLDEAVRRAGEIGMAGHLDRVLSLHPA